MRLFLLTFYHQTIIDGNIQYFQTGSCCLFDEQFYDYRRHSPGGVDLVLSIFISCSPPDELFPVHCGRIHNVLCRFVPFYILQS